MQELTIKLQYAAKIAEGKIDNIINEAIEIIERQEKKDAAFEAALELIGELQTIINRKTDFLCVVNVESFKDGYYGS